MREKTEPSCGRKNQTALFFLPVMLTSTHIWIRASPQLRGHMPAMSAHDGVKGQQAGMRHHGCKLNEVITLGGCKIMGSSLESSGRAGPHCQVQSHPAACSTLPSPSTYLLPALSRRLRLTFRVPCYSCCHIFVFFRMAASFFSLLLKKMSPNVFE